MSSSSALAGPCGAGGEDAPGGEREYAGASALLLRMSSSSVLSSPAAGASVPRGCSRRGEDLDGSYGLLSMVGADPVRLALSMSSPMPRSVTLKRYSGGKWCASMACRRRPLGVLKCAPQPSCRHSYCSHSQE